MRVIGRFRLGAIKGRERVVDAWLAAWQSEISVAQWMTADDLLRQFPNAEDLGKGVFRFDVTSTAHSVEVLIGFRQQTILIKRTILSQVNNEA